MSRYEFDRWEKRRTLGKWWIVLKTTVSFVFVILLLEAALYWFYPGESYQFPVVRMIAMVFAGVGMGFGGWWTKEARYNNTILDNKIHEGLRLK